MAAQDVGQFAGRGLFQSLWKLDLINSQELGIFFVKLLVRVLPSIDTACHIC